ncbi:MAG: 50S ribosomal protein L29 [Planctomycetota bacterium]
MKIEEIRGKTNPELETALETTKRELFQLRFAATTGTESNTSRTSYLRRTVARIVTVLHERQTGIRGQEAVR